MAQSGYVQPNSGREYFYVKASVSEPFNWFYGAAANTAMVNLADHNSYQVTAELSYTGFSNWELRLRLIMLTGQVRTEFNEKASSERLEIIGRYYF